MAGRRDSRPRVGGIGGWALALACLAVVGCGGRASLGAQTAPAGGDPLARAEALADAGRLEAAR